MQSFLNPSKYDYRDFFSGSEWEKYGQLGHQGRKRKWLRGRLLAKYALLECLSRPGFLSVGENTCEIIKVADKNLMEYSAWMYQNARILSGNHSQSGPRYYSWNGKSTSINLSITHSDPMSFVYVSYAMNIGIDAQMVFTSMDPAFYRQNFSQCEKEWVYSSTRDLNIPETSLFTLVWTIKEAAVKADRDPNLSLWSLPSLSVQVPELQTGFLTLSDKYWFAEMKLFDVSINRLEGINHYRGALTSYRNHLICILDLKEK